MSRRVGLAALALLAVLSGGATCEATSTPGAATPGGSGDAGAASQQLETLTVGASGSMAGYSREKFPHWISQGSGCDTRDVVLRRDGQDVTITDGCKITSGSWSSVYDGQTFTDAGDIDIDHMVPLANAWRTGANGWTEQQRTDFANDLTRPQLLAVSATSNRSKGDQDPSQWKPPNQEYWCLYAQQWIAVKSHWKLAVTANEKAALTDMLARC